MELQNLLFVVGGVVLLRALWKSLYKTWKSSEFTIVKDRDRQGMKDLAKEILAKGYKNE